MGCNLQNVIVLLGITRIGKSTCRSNQIKGNLFGTYHVGGGVVPESKEFLGCPGKIPPDQCEDSEHRHDLD